MRVVWLVIMMLISGFSVIQTHATTPDVASHSFDRFMQHWSHQSVIQYRIASLVYGDLVLTAVRGPDLAH